MGRCAWRTRSPPRGNAIRRSASWAPSTRSPDATALFTGCSPRRRKARPPYPQSDRALVWPRLEPRALTVRQGAALPPGAIRGVRTGAVLAKKPLAPELLFAADRGCWHRAARRANGRRLGDEGARPAC